MVKRLFDILLTVASLPVAMPLISVTAIACFILHGRPIFFRQCRAGRNCRPFEIVKFRTLAETRDADGRLLPDRDRLTRFGSFLRSTSLDELPELMNILRGEMSIVGPRPLPANYLPRYTADEVRRHEVAPGLTGWAQVNGRNATTWDERLRLDLWYVDHQSLRLDLQIMARTLSEVIRRRGISAQGEATMSELPPRLRASA